LPGKFVDIWFGHLAEAAENRSNLLACLSEAEQQKSETFKLLDMRRRYIAVRALVRKTLAPYLAVEPVQVQFLVGEHGKPHLAGNELHFNISHTADELLIAVSNMQDIGVDIELIKPRTNLDAVAERCFSAAEYAVWQALDKDQQPQAFYRLWTKKEAFVKAVGRGIALGLDQCEVQVEVHGQLCAIPAEFGAASDWKVAELNIAKHVAAALITPAADFTLRCLYLQ
jgi:4'-phosphopantetheinyl transferase